MSDNESEICLREKHIIWLEGDCGDEIRGHKQPFPNIQKKFVIRKKILFVIMLKGIRMNDWEIKSI